MDPYIFDVTENDALSLEDKLQERRPLRYLNINDIINNSKSFCFLRTQEGRLKLVPQELPMPGEPDDRVPIKPVPEYKAGGFS